MIGLWKKRTTGFQEQWETPKGALIDIRPHTKKRGSDYALSIYPAKIGTRKTVHSSHSTKKKAIAEAIRFMKQHKQGY